MYEKPQYLTPDGYRRSSVNPLGSKKQTGQAGSARHAALKKIADQRASLKKNSERGISEQAAKLIARA